MKEILTRKEASALSKQDFYRFVNNPENGYEKVEPGVYIQTNANEDDMYILQLKFEKAVFSHTSALYLLGLSDREPLHLSVTMPNGYNTTTMSKRGINVFTVKKDLFSVGLTKATTIFGYEVSCYNRERTIVDLVRSRSRIELQQYLSGIKNYFQSSNKNLNLLYQYAKLFRVENKIQELCEVLL